MNFLLWTLLFSRLIPLFHGFEYKTVCLLDYVPNDEEFEGEEWEGGFRPPGVSWGASRGNYPPNTGYYGGEMEGDEREADEWNGGMMGGGAGVVGGGGWAGAGGGEMDEYEGGGGPGGYYGPHQAGGAGMQPGPGGGYVDADGEWEDARKRRRRKKRELTKNIVGRIVDGNGKLRIKRQIGGVMVGGGGGGMWRAPSPHTPVYLRGKLTCGGQSSIHIMNVTLGYSMTPNCAQASYYGCRGSSSKATQILHCQGMVGSCDVSLTRHFLPRCGQRVNFASIAYECIPVARRIDICSSHDADETGGVVISSPSYPLVQTSSTSNVDDVVTCECTIRAPADASIILEYLRAKLPGQYGSCEGDLLLLETPEQNGDGRYMIVSEICGTNYTTSPQNIQDNILRITFLGGSPVQHTHGGFIGKFAAQTSDGTPSLFHVSCQPPPSGNGKDGGVAGNGNTGSLTGNGNGENNQGNIDSDSSVKKSPGLLSGVVASLASVILIMGSVGALLIYKSVKNRRRRRDGRGRRPSVDSAGSDAVPQPPPTNTQRFLTKPRQIFRTSPPSQQPPPPPGAGQRPASPVAPSHRAPSPPTSPSHHQSTSVYCIAYDVEEDSETCPELATTSSLPPTISAPGTPAPPPRKKKDDETSRAISRSSSSSSSSSRPPASSSSSVAAAAATPARRKTSDTPYDNAKAASASNTKGKTRQGDDGARKGGKTKRKVSSTNEGYEESEKSLAKTKKHEKYEESDKRLAKTKKREKYEEPAPICPDPGYKNTVAAGVDIHDADVTGSYRAEGGENLDEHGEDYNIDTVGEYVQGDAGEDDDVEYSSIDEMCTIVTETRDCDETDT